MTRIAESRPETPPPPRGELWRHAEQLLRDLKRERALSEQRTALSGETDPLKRVTGQTSMDNAIRTVSDMIQRLDPARPTVDIERLPRTTAAAGVSP